MSLRSMTSVHERNQTVARLTGVLLDHCESVLIDDQKNIHCENLIGAVSVPLGIAGPMKVCGTKVNDAVYIPLATTEGALVASVNRGVKVLSAAGGAHVVVERIGANRGPIFIVRDITHGVVVRQWLVDHFDILAKEAGKTSGHIKLLQIESTLIGRKLYVRFSYDTQDAMGMNMVTIATDALARLIEAQTGAVVLAVAGNYDTDKKPSWLSFISGRGFRGWAEATINPALISDVLKTTPEKIREIVQYKCWGGSLITGSMGSNAHFANIVAAFYLATGQDAAHVVEGSHGVTSAEIMPDGSLYFAVYMPCIMLGTVGGGTKLITQSEARSLCNVQTSAELAEVLVASVLAGELSLIASLGQGSLAKSHQKLGR